MPIDISNKAKIMKLYKAIPTCILTLLFVTQAYAHSCSDIPKIILDSKPQVNESKLENKKYISKVLHHAAYLDQEIIMSMIPKSVTTPLVKLWLEGKEEIWGD